MESLNERIKLSVLVGLLTILFTIILSQNKVSLDLAKVADAQSDYRLAAGPRPTITPIPTPTCRQEIKKYFGVDAVGFDPQWEEWIWAKFSDIQNTNFFNLIDKPTLQRSDVESRQVSCNLVYLKQYSDRTFFEVMIIHELSHIIWNCADRAASHYSEHADVLKAEGAVTAYAQTAGCDSTSVASEDYAEMIAYYLNPRTQSQTATCASKSPNPYKNGGHPLHYGLSQKIIGAYP